MDEFELLRNVTVGQYLPGKSLVHRLDPRTKLVALTLAIIAVSFVDTYLGNAVLLVATFALLWVAQLPIGYTLGGIKPALPILAVFFVFQLLFGGNNDPTGSPILWQYRELWGPLNVQFTVTETSLRWAIVSIVRLLDFIVLTTTLTFTTTTSGLTNGLESLLGPFKVVRVPAHEIAMTLAIALRFVPTLAEELERIMKAQASRGADFGRRGRLRFLQQTLQLVPLLVPLFVSTFRRAEELILAMEARCYVGGRGRTRLATLQMARLDWQALAVVGAFAAFMVLVRFPY